MTPALPNPCGPISEQLLTVLRCGPGSVPILPGHVGVAGDVLADDDLQLALYCCYELHYRSFAGVADGWEWEPSLLRFRAVLEEGFTASLREAVDMDHSAGDVVQAIGAAIEAGSHQPSLSAWVEAHGTVDHFREFAIHRSAYQLKEADPHTWAIPRLAGGPKAALIDIQLDEYGRGEEEAMHASLFADTMAALGLDTAYGAYLDLLPGSTLATVNLVSMFGLHRRWRGALAGHLAVFESTSVGPMARYGRALARLGVSSRARRFYDVHVEADAEHQHIACSSLAGALAAAEPALADDIVFGARALMLVEQRFARHLLGSWAAGHSSLRAPPAIDSRLAG